MLLTNFLILTHDKIRKVQELIYFVSTFVKWRGAESSCVLLTFYIGYIFERKGCREKVEFAVNSPIFLIRNNRRSLVDLL